jgi:hypothetical protein
MRMCACMQMLKCIDVRNGSMLLVSWLSDMQSERPSSREPNSHCYTSRISICHTH